MACNVELWSGVNQLKVELGTVRRDAIWSFLWQGSAMGREERYSIPCLSISKLTI